jgi:hypothetical protein
MKYTLRLVNSSIKCNQEKNIELNLLCDWQVDVETGEVTVDDGSDRTI